MEADLCADEALRKELVHLLILMVAVAGCDVLFRSSTKWRLIPLRPAASRTARCGCFPSSTWRGFVSGLQRLSVFMQAGKIEIAFSYDVREKAFAKLQTLSFSYFDRTPIGWLMARMNSDIARLAEILSWSLMDLIWGLAVMLGVSVVMLIVNWKLALLVLMVVPVLAWLSVWFQVRILKNYRSVRRINSRITSAFNEGITGAKTTKTLVIEADNLKEFNAETLEMKAASVRAATLSALLCRSSWDWVRFLQRRFCGQADIRY
ncbi:MAG: ABC transporter transmembrane domain-containing protein [Holdemania massiliensis]